MGELILGELSKMTYFHENDPSDNFSGPTDSLFVRNRTRTRLRIRYLSSVEERYTLNATIHTGNRAKMNGVESICVLDTYHLDDELARSLCTILYHAQIERLTAPQEVLDTHDNRHFFDMISTYPGPL